MELSKIILTRGNLTVRSHFDDRREKQGAD